MKRLIVTGAKQAEFEDVVMPECPADGVVVRAKLTAVSTGTEIRVYRGIAVDEAGLFLHERVPFKLPTENGYSMVGDVVEVGAECIGLSVGDRVFARAAHRQFAAVSGNLVTPLPESIPDEEAVFLNILEVAHRGLRQADPSAGSDVAVVGQGVIGLSALAYAVAFGFRTAVIDPEPLRLEIAGQMGAMRTLVPDDDTATQTNTFFGDEGADVVLEAASSWAGIRTAMQIARTGAKIVVLSRHTRAPDFNPVGHPFLGKRLNLITMYGYPPEGHRWDFRHSVDLTIDLLARRRLNIAPMITHRFASDELPEVYRRLDEGDRSIVGAVIQWT